MVEIYALVDPRTEVPRYVGSSVSAHHRLSGHICDSKGAKAAWIAELASLGMRPKLVILLRVEDDIAEEEETRCMRILGRFGTLLNVMKRGRRGHWRRELKQRGLRPWQVAA